VESGKRLSQTTVIGAVAIDRIKNKFLFIGKAFIPVRARARPMKLL